MDFSAIDVETANPDLSSICQIGVVSFRNGQISNLWQSLVNPEDYFDGLNVSIHGIDENDVKRAPKFPDICDVVINHLRGKVVVSHTSFDRVAIGRVFEKYNVEQPECKWLDTAKVVRRAWSEYSQKGYGLGNMAQKLGIKFEHHNAQEDARAAGEILVHAIKKTGIILHDWFDLVQRPIGGKIAKEGNAEGPLYGEVLVFTGSLSIPRREAAELAAVAGCEIATSVTETLTILVVGDQDIRKLAGQEKSSKHRKAEDLIAKGQAIRILGESDFRRLVGIVA